MSDSVVVVVVVARPHIKVLCSTVLLSYLNLISTVVVLAQLLVLDCRVGGRKFNSRGQTNTQDLKMTEK